MYIGKAHTAEHIFIKALHRINKKVKVLKVDHKDKMNHVYVEIENLTWKDIIEASKITNKIILDDKEVKIEYFNTIKEAKAKYPDLRAYEERIKPPIRVVIVEKFDYSACTMPHVNKTGECVLFLPVGLRKAKKNKFEIDFLAGEQAIERVLEDSSLIRELTILTKTSPRELVHSISNILKEKKELTTRINKLTRQLFNNSPIIKLKDHIELKMVVGEGFNMDEMGRITSNWIKKLKQVVLILNKIDIDKYNILIAKSNDIKIDLREISKKMFKEFEGKGGGKENWIMGYIKISEDDINKIIKYLVEYS